MKINGVVAGILAVLCAAALARPALAADTGNPAPGLVRAKIGVLISSGLKDRMAKSRDRLRAGDMLRLYVHPEKAAYIYVVYSDRKEAVLLNSVAQETSGSTLVLPSVNESYEVDGTSRLEGFSIVVSPEPLSQVSHLFSGSVPHDRWAALEAELADKSRLLTTDKSQIPFAIAGNVRGGVSAGTGAVKKLRIYSGKDLVVKTYEFAVKK